MKKNFKLTVFYILSIMMLLSSCDSGFPEAPDWAYGNNESNQSGNTEILNSTDMVLIYGGDRSRIPYEWTTDAFDPYVNYIDKEKKGNWMFDAFLFLELGDTDKDGKKVMYTYYINEKTATSATQKDWKRLADYYFSNNTGIGALNRAVGNAEKTLGEQPKKRRVVIAIPEPIKNEKATDPNSSSVYWGTLDGNIMDFANAEDRILACKWYVDYVRAKFDEMQYKNIEFAGFYWLSETVGGEDDKVIQEVGKYVNQFNYNFMWIPYYKANGYDRWESLGFNTAYYQPNYFFNDKTPYSQLEDACKTAMEKKLNMELEFDYRALAKNDPEGIYASRLREYMNAYKKFGIWKNKFMAYYQDLNILSQLKDSDNPDDQDLYHEFCQFVITRPIRSK